MNEAYTDEDWLRAFDQYVNDLDTLKRAEESFKRAEAFLDEIERQSNQ